MTRKAGSIVIADDFKLPAVVTGYGNGTNTITATSWADLPTTTCTAAITNSHPTANLICFVEWGAWMVASANAVRCCPAVSGSITIAAGIGLGGPIGWGEIPVTGNAANPQQQIGGATYSLPASITAATFTMRAYRDSASGTQNVNYPTLRIIPLYFAI